MSGPVPRPAEARPVRVLYYIQGNVFGGAHNQCLQLARPLAERGYETAVLLPAEPGNAADRLRSAGIEVHQRTLTRIRAGRSPLELLGRAAGVARQASTLARFMVEERIDMVQLHGLLALDGARAGRRVGIPIVWQLIDTRPPPLLRRLLTPLVDRYADVVMTTGTRLLKEYPGIDGAPSRWVPFFPPVAAERFPPAHGQSRTALRHRLLGSAVDEATLVIGSLGNLNPQKGFEHLIEAVASLRAGGRQVALLVRGAPSPGHPEYHRSLVELLERHRFPPGTVAALPEDMTVPEYLSALDVFALTPVRRSEGVPTVMLEAMWTGLPCVVADVGGVRDALSDDIGAVCEAESPPSIADALSRVLDAGEAGRRRMSLRAREAAEERFTLDQCTAVHEAAYDLARSNHAARTGA